MAENSSETKLDTSDPAPPVAAPSDAAPPEPAPPESEEEPIPVPKKSEPPRPKRKLIIWRPARMKRKAPKKKRVWNPRRPKPRPVNMERIQALSKPSERFLKKDKPKKEQRPRPINFERLKVLSRPQSRPVQTPKEKTTRPINYERMDELAQPHSRFLTNTFDEYKAVMSKKKQARIEAMVGELRLITAEEQQAFIRQMTRPKTVIKQQSCPRVKRSLADKEERLLLNHILSVCQKKLPKRMIKDAQKTGGGTTAGLLKLMNTAYGNICTVKGWPKNDLQASAYRLVADKIAKFTRIMVLKS